MCKVVAYNWYGIISHKALFSGVSSDGEFSMPPDPPSKVNTRHCRKRKGCRLAMLRMIGHRSEQVNFYIFLPGVPNDMVNRGEQLITSCPSSSARAPDNAAKVSDLMWTRGTGDVGN